MEIKSSEEEKSYFIFFLGYIAVAGGFAEEERQKIREVGNQIKASQSLIDETLDIFKFVHNPEIGDYETEKARSDKFMQEKTLGAIEYFFRKDSPELNKRLYKALIKVANADGTITVEERKRVHQVAAMLSLSPEECKQLESELSMSEIQETYKKKIGEFFGSVKKMFGMK